jgi:hypothetical protein
MSQGASYYVSTGEKKAIQKQQIHDKNQSGAREKAVNCQNFYDAHCKGSTGGCTV